MIYVSIIFGFILIFIFFVLPIIQNVSDFSKNKIESIKTDIQDFKEKQDYDNLINSYEQEYISCKRKFQYFSDETLNEMLINQKENDSLYYLLALEETLVERKLINFSPTHEKLQKIEDYFKK